MTTGWRDGVRAPRRIGLTAALLIVDAIFFVLGAGFTVASFFTSSQASVSAYTQSSGVRENAVVRNVSVRTEVHCGTPTSGRRGYGNSGNCSMSYDARIAVALSRPVGGQTASVVHVAQNVAYSKGQPLSVLVDPQEPGYAELPGVPYVTQTTVLVFEILGGVFLVLGAAMLVFGVLRRRLRRRFASAP